MNEKKKLLLNCDVCDTRKMNEDNYSHYEDIVINTDILIVNESSKAILSRLPVTINNDRTIELEDGEDICVKSVNGSYEISGNSSVEEHTVLVVNGSLTIQPGTEEILKKYDGITVNGNVRYPKSLEGFIGKMQVNGSIEVYPDDCVVLNSEFTIDQYFPLRAKEGGKYYVEDIVIIKDTSVDVAKLAGKGVHFETKKLLIPECKIEDSIPMFDESVEFIVIPDGMKLICGDSSLNEELVRNEGERLFIYGDMEIDKDADMQALCGLIQKLIVKGTVRLGAEQEEAFRSIGAEADKIEIIKNNKILSNMAKVKIDRMLFDNAPDGIEVHNVAVLTITEDITPEMILKKLTVKNCAKISCSEEQESAVAAVSKNVISIGVIKGDKRRPGDEGNPEAEDSAESEGGTEDESGMESEGNTHDEGSMENAGGILEGMKGFLDSHNIDLGNSMDSILGNVKSFLDTKKINADNYVM